MPNFAQQQFRASMSLLGQTRKSERAAARSALPPRTDIAERDGQVSIQPI
jgi:hypothetical protein